MAKESNQQENGGAQIDRLSRLPPETTEHMLLNLDLSDLRNMRKVSTYFRDVIDGSPILNNIRDRKFSSELAGKLYDAVMSEGVPETIWQDTRPEIVGHDNDRVATTAEDVAATIGTFLGSLDDKRQADFVERIKASPARREMIQTLSESPALENLSPKLRAELLDTVVDDLEDNSPLLRFEAADTLENAYVRGNLTHGQVRRIMEIRLYNEQARQEYSNQVILNYGHRMDRLHRERQEGRDTATPDVKSVPQQVEDALAWQGDRRGRLYNIGKVGKKLSAAAKGRRLDLHLARESRGLRDRERGRDGR